MKMDGQGTAKGRKRSGEGDKSNQSIMIHMYENPMVKPILLYNSQKIN